MTPSDLVTPESSEDASQEFSFRPITQGLGFHHDKQQWPKPKANQSSPLQKSRTNPQPASVQARQESSPEQRETSALHKIYGYSAAVTKPALSTRHGAGFETSVGKQNLSDVPVLSQFTAWIIDLMVIGLGTFFIILCSSFITFGNFFGPFYSSVSTEFYLLFTTLFCLFYLFYFTLLDLNSSIGKSLMSIKVVSTDKSQIEMKDTFIRALVTLISLMGLGIPAALDFQGKLSKTTLKK
ncbi:MAG: hypothetical protein A2X86_05490 [Bdellovibrionales bacterium GWA2_49_15]|nr:MAG: hypothetical protein A2X86_05490 [Bdellovibrionales bacterium GWA2_49_15]